MREEVDRAGHLKPAEHPQGDGEGEGAEGNLVVGVCQVGGPVLGNKVHQDQALTDEEDNRKKKEEGLPNCGGQREAGVGSLAVIPKSGPAVEGNETPEGIEKWNEHKANSFAAIKLGPEHVHHVPAPVKVCQAKDKPVNAGDASEAKSNDPNVALGNLKGSSNQCAHCDKGEE